MTLQNKHNHFDETPTSKGNDTNADQGIRRVAERLGKVLERDELVYQTVHDLRARLQTDRVVLYYFYDQWEGQVTFEALNSHASSIIGLKGPDQCFNGEYAAMYEVGRVRAIPDIELEAIEPCHRDFLRQLEVRANLVVPVLNRRGLWGLLVAHHCRSARPWSLSDIDIMKEAAESLGQAAVIQNS